jgi:hypothetical protein
MGMEIYYYCVEGAKRLATTSCYLLCYIKGDVQFFLSDEQSLTFHSQGSMNRIFNVVPSCKFKFEIKRASKVNHLKATTRLRASTGKLLTVVNTNLFKFQPGRPVKGSS